MEQHLPLKARIRPSPKGRQHQQQQANVVQRMLGSLWHCHTFCPVHVCARGLDVRVALSMRRRKVKLWDPETSEQGR
eukprot:2044492-Amphidinium_carterae.2